MYETVTFRYHISVFTINVAAFGSVSAAETMDFVRERMRMRMSSETSFDIECHLQRMSLNAPVWQRTNEIHHLHFSSNPFSTIPHKY